MVDPPLAPLSQATLESIRITVWIALSFGIFAIPLSIVAIILNARRFSLQAKNRVGDGKWTRFQTLMMVVLLIALIAAACSIASLTLLLEWFPERLDNPISCAAVIFDEGWLLGLATLLELIWQVLLQAGEFAYFILIMNRYFAFRMFIPGGTSQIVRMSLFAIGTTLYGLTFAQNIIVNIRPRNLTLSDLRCKVCLTFQMGHVFFVGTLDLAIAFFLYRTALSLDKVRSWSVLQRPFGQRSSEVSRSIVEHNELVSMNQNTTASTASQRAGQASMPASGGSEVTVYSPNMQRSQPRTLIQKIFSSRHHRRVTLLLILAVFMQVLGGSFFVIPVAFPGLSQKSRAYESISMNLYLLHLLVILWFLESFKEVVLAPGSGTRAGEYFSSITVEPQSGNAGTTS